MSKEFLDWTTATGAGSGLEMLANSVRKGINFDVFDNVTRFEARVLTDAYPLSEAQAQAFVGASSPTIAPHGPNANERALAGGKKVLRVLKKSMLGGSLMGVAAEMLGGDDDTSDNANPQTAPTQGASFSRFIFKARIINHNNSPHAFIPDPCDPAFAECPQKALPYVMMHTAFVSTVDNNSEDVANIKKGDIVIVELSRNEFSFNLQFGKFVKRQSTAVQNLAQRTHEREVMQECKSLSNLFSDAEGTLKIGVPSPPPHRWRGTIFSDNGWIKEEYIPQRILEIPPSLHAWLHAQGRTDVTISSNGKRRGVQQTLAGGQGRIKTSYHMFGLAHDLKLETTAVTDYAYPASNDTLIKDHQLMRLLKKYATQKNLVWGGTWAQGTPEQIPAGDGVEAFTAYTMELHHFELPQTELEGAIHPQVRKLLTEGGYITGALRAPGENRVPLYTEIGREFGVV